MELMNEQQFNALSDVEKYDLYKDLAFKHITKQYEWKCVVNEAKNGNIFNTRYYSDFVKKAVDEFGYEYVVEKLIEAQKEIAEESDDE